MISGYRTAELTSFKIQAGVVLLAALIFLLILSLVGLTALQNSRLSRQMTANAQLSSMSLNAAESSISRYIAEYNYFTGSLDNLSTQPNSVDSIVSQYIPMNNNNINYEYCYAPLRTVRSMLLEVSDENLQQGEDNCEPFNVVGDNGVLNAKTAITYQGCPGNCAGFSMGVGTGKISCHYIKLQSEGRIERTSGKIEQWVSIKGPC